MMMVSQCLLLVVLLLPHHTIMISRALLLTPNPRHLLSSSSVGTKIPSIWKYPTTTTTTTAIEFTTTHTSSLKSSSLCMMSSSSSSSIEKEIRTLAPGVHVSEMEVKKSRFIAYAKHAETWEEAQNCIHEIKLEHPKARHWCYGFQCGVNPVSERCSDDGEPTGTAGVPILGGIKGEELSDVVCVVVRYFGGIKLGAGGLIRAYGGAARQVLREAPVDILIPKSTFRVKVGSSYVGSIYDSVAKVGGVTGGEEYGADASLSVTITCDLEVADQLRDTLKDATRGSAEFLDG